MAVETAADRAAFLADFGEDVVLSWRSPDTITAIVDKGHVAVALGLVEVSSREQVVWCQTSDVDDVTIDVDTVTVGGTVYTVADHQPDGTGMSVLIGDLR